MDNSILEAVKVLKEGGLILYPTDTIWGVGLLVSTSANISGEPSPKNFDEIPQCIKDGVDYIVNPELALESSGKASQIIKVGLDSEIKIIRA